MRSTSQLRFAESAAGLLETLPSFDKLPESSSNLRFDPYDSGKIQLSTQALG